MELAIITERPAFNKPLYVGAPLVEKGLREAYFKQLADIFDQNWFTNNGRRVQELEREISKIHGVKHCIAVCNATIGQMLVLKAFGIEGEVIMPSFTFVATAHACLWQGIKPVFCDIHPDTLMIDAKKVEGLITDKTSAVIGVHLFGNVCDVQGLNEIRRRRSLKVIFDAAHAFNCSLRDKSIGNFGDAEILSFHATKFFSTFEGGAILTNDSDLNNRIRFLKNFGFSAYDDVRFLGINAKMSEPTAAMGLVSLQAIEARAERLKKNYGIYCGQLCSIPGLKILPVGQNGRSNYHYMIIFIDEEKLGVSRDLLQRVLWKENVIARKYFYPGCHRMEPYNTLYPNIYKTLPVTEDIAMKILCLPTNLENPQSDIATISGIIKAAHKNADVVLKWTKDPL